MGSSRGETKNVTVSTEHTCPVVVNEDNWLGGENHPDTFSVEQFETYMIVTRTDLSTGWQMDLIFECCGKVSYMKHSNAFAFKFYALSNMSIHF